MLKLNVILSTLGEIFSNLKTLTKKWLSELSQKLHFLHSYWRPDYSYGLTLIQQAQRSSQAPMVKHFVYQVFQITRSASTTGTKPKLNSIPVSLEERGQKLNSLSHSLGLGSFKIRLFNGLYTFWDNKRLRWGMLFLLVLAPLSKFFYLLLPEGGFGEYLINIGPLHVTNTFEGVDSGWYFAFFDMYFFTIGELMAPTLSIFGIFLLFPKKYYPSYLVGVPFGYYFSMLVHRMFFVDSYESFHNGFTTTMTFTFLILGVVFFMVSDKVLFKQNHGKRASEARIIGLINMPGMEWTDKEEIIRKEVAEAMKVDNELFIRETA